MNLPRIEANGEHIRRKRNSWASYLQSAPALKLESFMNTVQIEQKIYEMPPKQGISIAQFLTVANIERSARYYEKVFGARI